MLVKPLLPPNQTIYHLNSSSRTLTLASSSIFGYPRNDLTRCLTLQTGMLSLFISLFDASVRGGKLAGSEKEKMDGGERSMRSSKRTTGQQSSCKHPCIPLISAGTVWKPCTQLTSRGLPAGFREDSRVTARIKEIRLGGAFTGTTNSTSPAPHFRTAQPILSDPPPHR